MGILDRKGEETIIAKRRDLTRRIPENFEVYIAQKCML